MFRFKKKPYFFQVKETGETVLSSCYVDLKPGTATGHTHSVKVYIYPKVFLLLSTALDSYLANAKS